MSDKIKHSGIIETVDDKKITVRIVQLSACASCSAAAKCKLSEKKEKLIDVYDFDNNQHYKSGDEVIVYASMNSGKKAVLIGFGMPLILLLVVITLMTVVAKDELISALVAVGCLALYYLSLYILKNKLKKDFSFYIDKN